MQHKSFENMPCPIARSLARVGEWWSMLILRDALHGMTRFDQFQKSLGIAPNMLTRRLNALIEAGLLSRRRYSEKPPRDEYLLTARGRASPAGARAAAGGRHPPLRARGRERAAGRPRARRRRGSDPGGPGHGAADQYARLCAHRRSRRRRAHAAKVCRAKTPGGRT